MIRKQAALLASLGLLGTQGVIKLCVSSICSCRILYTTMKSNLFLVLYFLHFNLLIKLLRSGYSAPLIVDFKS